MRMRVALTVIVPGVHISFGVSIRTVGSSLFISNLCTTRISRESRCRNFDYGPGFVIGFVKRGSDGIADIPKSVPRPISNDGTNGDANRRTSGGSKIADEDGSCGCSCTGHDAADDGSDGGSGGLAKAPTETSADR